MGDSSQTKSSSSQSSSLANSSGSNTSVQDPWAPSQPYLTGILGQTQGQYDATSNPATNGALKTGQNAAITNATQGNTTNLANQGMGSISSLLGSGGLSDEQRSALDNIGSSVGTFNTNQGQAASYLTPIANGSQVGINNQAFQTALKGSLQDASDTIASQYAGLGRYGSQAMDRTMADRLGTIAASATQQQYNQDLQSQLAAIGQMSGNNSSPLSGNLSGATTQAGIGQQGIASQLAGIGTIGGLNEAQGADANTLMGVGNQGWSNVGNAASIFSNLAGQGKSSSGTTSGSIATNGKSDGTETTETEMSPLGMLLAGLGGAANIFSKKK